MYSQTIVFEDYGGVKREETHRFNLTKAEFLKFLTTNGEYTIDEYMEKLSKENRGRDIIDIIERLVDTSYGRKSLDGRRFEKSPEILKEFKETEGYSEFFYDLVTDSNKAAKFITGILPQKLMDQVRAELAKSEDQSDLPEELRNAIMNKNA